MAKVNRTVGLEGVKFVSPIGFFDEERILKNEFIVNLSVSFDVDIIQNNADDLNNTVDYSQLFEICALYFNQEFKLLESVAHYILNDVLAKYSFVNSICIRINKLNPPISSEIRNSFIELEYNK